MMDLVISRFCRPIGLRTNFGIGKTKTEKKHSRMLLEGWFPGKQDADCRIAKVHGSPSLWLSILLYLQKQTVCKSQATLAISQLT